MLLNSLIEKIKITIENGFLHILFGSTLTKVIAFASSIFIVRYVDKLSYAYLVYADNIYSYIFLISTLGMDTAVLKFCSTKDKIENSSYFLLSLKYGFCFVIFITFALLIFVYHYDMTFPNAKIFIYVLSVYPLLYFLICMFQAFTRASLKNREFAYASLINTLCIFFICICFFYFIDIYSIVIARYVAAVFVIIYLYRVIKSNITFNTKILSKESICYFMKYSISVLLANVFSMIMPLNEVLLINYLLKDPVATANYKVASMIPLQITFVTSSIITYGFPYFARMKDMTHIWIKSKRLGLANFIIIIAVAILGIAISPFIIQCFYGNKYQDSYELMILLWIVHSINAGIRMVPLNILPAIGITSFNLKIAIVSSVIHFVVDYYLIFSFGLHGAIFASFFVYLFTGILYWIYLYKKTNNKNMEERM